MRLYVVEFLFFHAFFFLRNVQVGAILIHKEPVERIIRWQKDDGPAVLRMKSGFR